MRSLLLSALLLSAVASQAQVVATFDDLTLSKADTFYVNYTSSGNDVGFNDGLFHFPCVYDTAYGGYWDYGFSYSNMVNDTTDGYTNQYAAITASGYDNTPNYAVAYSFGPMNLPFSNSVHNRVVDGFYITNSTYAYLSMLNGNDYPAKKFGGATGNDPDWFKLTIRGYSNGQLNNDSVEFYLADYRFTDNDSDYIVKTWQWVNLQSLGAVDSLQFALSSSDTAGGYGMNTPAYFCVDNVTANFTESVNQVNSFVAKVYPNPATSQLFVDINDNSVTQANICDMLGKVVGSYTVSGSQLAINTASLPAGAYILQLGGEGKTATVRFVKQ
jgi:hypothetical protein